MCRLNDAPVKEHKKDVGERTSIRLFFPESALPNPLENNDNDTLMAFVPFKPLDFLWIREVLLKTRNKVRCLSVETRLFAVTYSIALIIMDLSDI